MECVLQRWDLVLSRAEEWDSKVELDGCGMSLAGGAPVLEGWMDDWQVWLVGMMQAAGSTELNTYVDSSFQAEGSKLKKVGIQTRGSTLLKGSIYICTIQIIQSACDRVSYKKYLPW